MIKKSISFKIFMVFVLFTMSIFLLIGIAIKVFLPDYYVNKKIEAIEVHTKVMKEDYQQMSAEEISGAFEALQSDVGGDVYRVDEDGHDGVGKNKKNSEISAMISGDIFENRFVNKFDIEIYLFGIRLDDEYIVYEVSVQSLEEAVDVIMEFFLLLLLFSLIIAIIIAYIISIQITKPIKKLNQLAKRMKAKEVHSLEMDSRSDELGELNQSINLLYEELLSNIGRLESELQKERQIESLKKQFLAQATHELKTPLSVIQGYAELVYDKIYKDDQERDHFIKSIYSETENMGKLITDVLDFSKMENGFYTISKEETFVNPWINNIIGTFKDIIQSKGIDFVVNNKVGDLCISMDAFRVEQAIKNLLSNAMEHSNKRITFNAYDLNGQLAIEVINTGKLINQEDLPFVFDSFYKTKGKKSGSGLGLAIVKGIVKLHQGEYRVENIEDGVKFTIVI